MSSPSDTDELALDSSLFEEPPSYARPPTPPCTFSTHTLLSGPTFNLRLVGHDPLWGHHLWNSGRVIANYLETHAEELVRGKDVLELGAGAGLPGLVCGSVGGARRVVITDYPSPALISNIQYNIDHCALPSSAVIAKGYLWGRDPSDLLHSPSPPTTDPPATISTNAFTLLILSDLLFNHSEHPSLLHTLRLTLSTADPSACALVFFTPHRPWLYEKDMAFFDLAKQGGFTVEKVVEEVLPKPMFEEDRGDVELRRRVFGYKLRWAEQGEQKGEGGQEGV